MDASLRPARRGAVPAGMLGMIALVALIEAGLRRDDRFGNDMAEGWRIKAAAATREAVGSDVLALGDSLVEFGILPPVLEERLGGKAYNLALHAGTPSASYFLLKRALDAGAKPRAIVVDFMPHQIVKNPGHERHRGRAWPELVGLGEAIDLARTMHDPDLAATIVAGKLLASVQARPEIRAAVVAALKGETRPVDDALRVPIIYRNLKMNRGAYLMPESSRPAADPRPSNTDLTSTVYEPSRFVYIRRFLRLAESRGIPVYWVVMPISPEYQAASDASGSDALYSAFVANQVRRFANLVVLDGRRAPGYGPGRFIDAIHMDGKSASALTHELADLILRPASPDAPRHVALAPYRDRPPARDLEDVLESKLAFARAWQAGHAPRR